MSSCECVLFLPHLFARSGNDVDVGRSMFNAYVQYLNGILIGFFLLFFVFGSFESNVSSARHNGS